jgi:hypothetical protein
MHRTVGFLVSVCALACGGEEAPKGEHNQPAKQVCGVEPEYLPGQTSEHVLVGVEVPYLDPPPVGGVHSHCWADYGVYEEELADETWVHNLEHGAVVLLYNCPSGCPNEVAELEAFASGHQRVIVTPYAALPTRFGATAWEWRWLSDCFDLPAIEGFYQQRFGKGRENIAGGPPDVCR